MVGCKRHGKRQFARVPQSRAAASESEYVVAKARLKDTFPHLEGGSLKPHRSTSFNFAGTPQIFEGKSRRVPVACLKGQQPASGRVQRSTVDASSTIGTM